MLYRIRVWWVRQLNRLPRRAALIKKIASLQWEQEQIVDHVLGTHTYEPGAWWWLRRLGSA